MEVTHGYCDPAFVPVREELEDLLTTGGDLGSSLAVSVDGRLVVDLWGGYEDIDRARPWGKRTVAPVASASKGLTALCVHLLASDGALALDDPVSAYWPEFAAGKERVTVRELLAHRAGAVGEREPVPPGPDRLERYLGALAAVEPYWQPGTAHGYHAKVFHLLAGELVRRVSGRPLADLLAERVTGPLGIDLVTDVTALPEDVSLSWPTWSLTPPPPDADMLRFLQRMGGGEDPVVRGAFLADPPEPEMRPGDPMPVSTGGVATNGRALATVYGALACDGAYGDVRLLRAPDVKQLLQPVGSGEDLVLGFDATRCAGYFVNAGHGYYGESRSAFGHDGAGGASGFGDPEHRLGFGYVMNTLTSESVLRDSRKLRLVKAVYACL